MCIYNNLRRETFIFKYFTLSISKLTIYMFYVENMVYPDGGKFGDNSFILRVRESVHNCRKLIPD